MKHTRDGWKSTDLEARKAGIKEINIRYIFAKPPTTRTASESPAK
jgi:hypothetical protein